MNSTSSGLSPTVLLTGLLPAVLLIAAFLSLPVSFFLMRRYRRAVIAGMNRLAGSQLFRDDSREVPVAAVPPPPGQPLRIREIAAELPDSKGPEVLANQRLRRRIWAYLAGGITYAVVMTVGWMLATADPRWGPWKTALLIWTYLWPLVIGLVLVVFPAGRRRRRWLLAYFGVLLALLGILVVIDPGTGLLSLLGYWLLMNSPGSVLMWTFLMRPIRAVGPLVLAFLLVASLGSQLIVSLVGASAGLLKGVARAGFALGLGGRGVFVGLILIGLVAFAALGWPLLRWIGRRYERGLLSDQTLMMDSVVLLFAAIQSVGLAFEGPAWILTGPGAYLAGRMVTRAAFGGGRTAAGAPRTLLLLRVFRLGRRSEALFDVFGRAWQELGPIHLITGPDLASSTVEPHQFLEFVSGRLSEQYIAGVSDLERRMASLGPEMGPDGRYRTRAFFCRSDTWQATMDRLAHGSDVVLMDLRSFSPGNDGCLFELGRLLDGIDLDRVMFLADTTTDRGFLASTLERLWALSALESPNRRKEFPTATVILLDDRKPSESWLPAMLRRLLTGSGANGAMPV